MATFNPQVNQNAFSINNKSMTQENSTKSDENYNGNCVVCNARVRFVDFEEFFCENCEELVNRWAKNCPKVPVKAEIKLIPVNNSTYTVNICEDFVENGYCKHGDFCHKLHPGQQEQPIDPKKFYVPRDYSLCANRFY